jgi:hypothetical protein
MDADARRGVLPDVATGDEIREGCARSRHLSPAGQEKGWG